MYAIKKEYLTRGMHLVSERMESVSLTTPPGTKVFYYDGPWIYFDKIISVNYKYPQNLKKYAGNNPLLVTFENLSTVPAEEVFIDGDVGMKIGYLPNQTEYSNYSGNQSILSSFIKENELLRSEVEYLENEVDRLNEIINNTKDDMNDIAASVRYIIKKHTNA